jgi:hypothetical protein
VPEEAPTPVSPTALRTSDESFSTFYNTFENLFSKLSAPLAFAGLPLTAEQAIAENAKAAAKKEKTRAPSSDDPDLTKIYSGAALRAIREDAGPSFGPQESFYLVPPTGGTVSYAGILTSGRNVGHEGRSGAQVPETIEEDADEFVDARESLGPPSPRSLRSSRKGGSPTASRDGGRKGFGKSTSGKTIEELELENNELKQHLDHQAKRLQMWEMSSQSQSMALQQSIRAARPPPPLPTAISDPSALGRIASSESDRVKELEELLKAERAEKESLAHKNESIGRENERLHDTVGRYRAKWEQLKAGARKRENDKKAGVSGAPILSRKDTEVEGDAVEES